MNSGNGVSLEHENGVVEITTMVEELGMNTEKENGNFDKVVDVMEVKDVSEDLSNVKELDTSALEVEASASISPSLDSPNKSGVGDANGVKSSKVTSDHAGKKGSTTAPKSQKPTLSQSRSFASRGTSGNGQKKSTDGKSVKANALHPQTNGQAESGVASRSNLPNRQASTGVSSSNATLKTSGPSARRTTLPAVPSSQRSLTGKLGSGNASTRDPSSDISLSDDQNQQQIKGSVLSKDDEDTHSITSTTTPRGTRVSASGFTFRLGERAEKRREYYSKLEERIHAKEVEKNNLQAKSKESQEAEIKQLRKSLTFKAAPMPSFYKEPPPPKTELKKIPTTRAKSPKLGRNKTSVVAPNSSESSGPLQSPRRSSMDHIKPTKRSSGDTNVDTVATNAPIRRSSLSKVPSKKSATVKPETKQLSKPKAGEPELDNQKAEDIGENKTNSLENPPSLNGEATIIEETQSSSMEKNPSLEIESITDEKKSNYEDIPTLEIESIAEPPTEEGDVILHLPDPEITC